MIDDLDDELVVALLPNCDCLNHCGDDPWLKKGKAKPCQQYLDNLPEAVEARATDRHLNAAERVVLLREAGLGLDEVIGTLNRLGLGVPAPAIRAMWRVIDLCERQ